MKSNSYKNLFFSFYSTLAMKLGGKAMAEKNFHSNYKVLLTKQPSISTQSTKLIILLLLNMLFW